MKDILFKKGTLLLVNAGTITDVEGLGLFKVLKDITFETWDSLVGPYIFCGGYGDTTKFELALYKLLELRLIKKMLPTEIFLYADPEKSHRNTAQYIHGDMTDDNK